MAMLNQTAPILGPTGLAHDTVTDILYVASTADNTIYGVPKCQHQEYTAR
jgi:hypothetical protein